MLKNFFLTAIRSMLKQKAYFVINVLGLAIGLTSFVFISLYVIHERSYDRFHNNYENIYRVKVIGQMSGQVLDQAVTAAPMAKALIDDYPEVEKVVRLGKFGAWLMRYEEKSFNEDNVLFADSSFFDVFNFKLIEGNPKDVLLHPRSIILSESHAKKYFGDEDPIGKSINVEQDTVFYKVTGIVEDAPENAHFHYDMIASLTTLANSRSIQWVSHNHYTYIVLKEGTDPNVFEKKLEQMVIKYVGPQIKQILGISIDDFREMGNDFGYSLQKLTDIHLKSNVQEELEPNGNMAYVNIFSIVAVLILIIAIINFVNLATAKSSSRAKEVGIRKTIGATKSGLVYQFLGESLVLTLIATSITIVAVALLSPGFNQLLGIELIYDLFNNNFGLISLLILSVIVGIIAGIYPAFILSSFQPIKVLKGSFSGGTKSKVLRSSLVILQFVISITIIIGTTIVYKQLNYMQNKSLGFDKEELLILKRPDFLKKNLEPFKQELLQNAYIKGVANAKSIPGKKGYSNNGIWKENDPEKNTYLLLNNWASFEYAEVLGLELVQGRYFSHEFGTDSTAIIINEKAVEVLGLEEPVLGQNLLQPENNGEFSKLKIIGVFKDYHIQSLHREIEPSVLNIMAGNWEGYLLIRLNTTNLQSTLATIEESWNKYSAGNPFNYFFFEEEYNQLYVTEVRTGKIFTVFAILAIFIACLGLIGLITYTSAVRTKEIGIRKVHGASTFIIVKLLSFEVIKLILIATVIAWPIAYFGSLDWLQSFAHQTTISPLTFILSTLIALLIGWLAISFKAIQVALRNPVDALKYE